MTPCSWPIADLLPHAAPMILIDRLVSYDAEHALAEVTVRADHPFATKDGVPAHLGIEFMAQTCGALTGAWAKADGTKVQVGFLLGTRNFTATRTLLPIGAHLTISVTVVVRDGEMGVFDCCILAGDETVAEARLNVYQPASDEAARSILARGQ
jgi:predicted hotdog family 3-hydroxylacyl-ACP dehydratase